MKQDDSHGRGPDLFDASGDSASGGSGGGAPLPNRTPMYEAIHTPRYLRQELIKKIQEKRGRRLICYVAGIKAHIDRDDTLGFVELLHNVQKDGDLDLLIHTAGGDIDAAEKL